MPRKEPYHFQVLVDRAGPDLHNTPVSVSDSFAVLDPSLLPYAQLRGVNANALRCAAC